MSSPTTDRDVARIDAEIAALAEARQHTREELWQEIWAKRIDTLLDRRNSLTRP